MIASPALARMPTMFRIAQISDTHLSAAKPYFVENFELVCEAVLRAGLDMLVNTGDISLDGAGYEQDLIDAAELHRHFPLPVRTVPGNHDIGDNADVPARAGHAQPVVDAARRARYLKHFGDDWWRFDLPGWRIVGLNSLILGSDLPEAQAQAEFLREAATGAGSRRLALFAHKPLCDADLGETAVGGRFLNPGPRRALLAALAGVVPAVIACGHVHQYRDARIGGTRHVWAPSTGFTLPDALQPRYGVKRLGYVEHRFAADGSHDCALIETPETEAHCIIDFPDAYGSLREDDALHLREMERAMA